MSRTTYAPIAVAALLILAGCAGGIGGAGDTTTPSTTQAPDASGGTDDSTGGTVQFYISDERNAISDFEHLNVTVTKIGFKKADADEDEETTEESDTTTTTSEATTTTTSDTTTTTGETTTTNETTTGETTTTAATRTTTDATTTTTVDDDADEAEPDEEKGGEDWVTDDVNRTTIDLTEYQGANATRIANVTLPNGTYETVFVYVSDVEGVLKSGETVNVKLPSQKLKLPKEFTVGDGEAVSFVFDITVFKAGKSGKYILKPVVGQSGTDVPIETPDDEAAERGEREADDRDDRKAADERKDGNATADRGGPEADDRGQDRDAPDAAGSLNVSVAGQVAAGENVTVRATAGGEAVANATVTVNGEAAGETGPDGTLTITVPDAEELEIEVERGDAEAELTRTISR